MKVWLNRFLAISLAAAFVLTVTSQANADRRTGLHGNQLIKDVTDIATFPQAAAGYKNLVRIDMGGDNAWFVVGDDSATYGVKATASDANHPTVLDMVYAMPLGADALGVGLSLGMGGVTPADGDASSDMAIGLDVGYTMSGMNLETALSVDMNNTDDGSGDNTTSAMNIGLNARGYHNLGESTDLGYMVGFGMDSNSATVGGDDGDASSAMAVAVGAGPVYNMDKAKVAAYGTLNFNSNTNTPAVGDETSTSSLGFPGFLVSAEVHLSDSLIWRGGASYGYSSDTAADESSSASGNYSWSSGLGYKWDKFQLDGAVDSGFYNRGPNFISGGTGDLFTHVTASYSF
jgi:hypothetical protein